MPAERPPKAGLSARHRELSLSPLQKAGRVLDHLVDALAGDPSSPLRRVLVLIDIAQHPGTSQTAIMERLNFDKSFTTRTIHWLYNYGCVVKGPNHENARESSLSAYGVARTHLGHAASLLRNDLKLLQFFVEEYITLLKNNRATLRDAKIVTVLGGRPGAPRQALFDELYNGPITTDSRALKALLKEGIVTDGT